MADSLAGLVLAAGSGSRLWPLTARLPKALCPVGDRPLLDHALDRLAPVLDAVAVNTHHLSQMIIGHLDASARSVHVSEELPVALGTAGAVGNLAGWLDGRAVLVTNADTWHTSDLRVFVEAWDRRRVAVFTNTAGDFGPSSSVVASIIPARAAARLPAAPSGLWEQLWRPELARGHLQSVHTTSLVSDCGTPARYLGANLQWAGFANGAVPGGGWAHPDAMVTGSAERSVVGCGAVVAGTIRGCVIWPGSEVGHAEVLSDAIRAGDLTVGVRNPVV